MTLREFFDLAIQTGIDGDPRGRAVVEKELQEVKKSYDEQKPEDRAVFDLERLHKPYHDSRILYGDPDRTIGKILVGIDNVILKICVICGQWRGFISWFWPLEDPSQN